MKSDIVTIDNRGNGFADAVETSRKIAEVQGLTNEQTIELKMLTEEMLSLVRSVTGEMQASFWLECAGRAFDLRMTTTVVMDKEKRHLLISSSSSRKNDAAKGLLGRLRDALEQAMLAEPEQREEASPDQLQDLFYHPDADPEWDRYERSILRKLADDVRIGIRGSEVSVTVSRRFDG